MQSTIAKRPLAATDDPAPQVRSSATRVAIGALLGGSSWLALGALLPILPIPARFVFAWLFFTFSAGVAAGAYLTRDLDPLRRVIVLLGFGSAATPVLVDLLGRLHLLATYPYVAATLGGIGLALWGSGS